MLKTTQENHNYRTLIIFKNVLNRIEILMFVINALMKWINFRNLKILFKNFRKNAFLNLFLLLWSCIVMCCKLLYVIRQKALCY